MSSVSLIYHREELQHQHETLKMIMVSSYFKIFKQSLKIVYSIGDGVYYTPINKQKITEEMCSKIESEMKAFITSNEPIQVVSKPKDFLISELTKQNRLVAIEVVKRMNQDPIKCICIGSGTDVYYDFYFDQFCTDYSNISLFTIIPYESGLLLRYPVITSPKDMTEFPPFSNNSQNSLFQKICSDSISSLSSIPLEYIWQFTESSFLSQYQTLIQRFENRHNEKLSEISSYIISQFPSRRVITIAGPSSSNKTTFAKRLALELESKGFQTIVLEMDDYFYSNDDIPYQPDGTQDWEHISALNVPLLSERVKILLKGESIPVRKFNFKLGIGEDHPELPSIILPKQAFLIMEGIHGLNDILLDSFGRNQVIPLFVTAIQPLILDENHAFPLTYLRLIRRMIRDCKFRNNSPRDTLLRWASVRLGEEKNIFSFQHNAEKVFNSAYEYELPVLSGFVKDLLIEAQKPLEKENPESREAKIISEEGKRIMNFLSFVGEIPQNDIPGLSFLREFIGGSDLKY